MLVGLDWVEPMMFLYCMSHVHTFLMHTYSLFNILAIFELFWDFSDCLLLSLPFFVYVSRVYGT